MESFLTGELFLIVLCILVLLSIEHRWEEYNYERCCNKDSQLAIRGLFVLLIIFSHMFRNTENYSDQLSASILHFLFPSIVCIFFFYSGYGLMFSFMKGKQKTIHSQMAHYLKKLGIPALIAYLITVFIAFFSKNKIPAISSIGGWFAQVLLLLYISYAIFSCIVDSAMKLLVLETVFVVGFTFGAKILGVSSFVYIDLPAFLFGMLVKLDEDRFRKFFQKKSILIASVILTGGGGGYLAMARYGIVSTGFGIGVILGFANSISEVVMIQILLSHICFKGKNLLNYLGKYSYEIYLAGAIAKPLVLMVCSSRIGYYSLYLTLCIVGGLLISKICNNLLRGGKKIIIKTRV